MSDTFQTPPEDDVFQEDEEPQIAVNVANVVRVDEMPTKIGGMFRVILGTSVEKILNGDARRKMVTILSHDQDIYLGPTLSEADPDGATIWPANVPLVLQASDEIFAAAVTATTTVSIIVEHWAR